MATGCFLTHPLTTSPVMKKNSYKLGSLPRPSSATVMAACLRTFPLPHFSRTSLHEGTGGHGVSGVVLTSAPLRKTYLHEGTGHGVFDVVFTTVPSRKILSDFLSIEMLEEFAMEKKPINRSVQPPGKGSTTDLKKSQDAGSKSFFRSSRRHEPNSSVASKWELGRKTASQKSKCFDKRPKPKGQYGGKEDPKVAAVEAVEYGSVIAPGSKKQNLNHLLNFHYAPREGSGSMWRSGGRQGLNRWMATHKHKYNKEQFLQANCQFVVKADGDYSVYSTNPDILVDWGLIEQITLVVIVLLAIRGPKQ
uniref:Uncharacterized protein n=1 Tax=Timema shepardi TaxID=629360 RepID=A0A7R9B000_TIMSH|nr:unnamed protein product [Timema shepardi]